MNSSIKSYLFSKYLKKIEFTLTQLNSAGAPS